MTTWKITSIIFFCSALLTGLIIYAIQVDTAKTDGELGEQQEQQVELQKIQDQAVTNWRRRNGELAEQA